MQEPWKPQRSYRIPMLRWQPAGWMARIEHRGYKAYRAYRAYRHVGMGGPQGEPWDAMFR